MCDVPVGSKKTVVGLSARTRVASAVRTYVLRTRMELAEALSTCSLAQQVVEHEAQRVNQVRSATRPLLTFFVTSECVYTHFRAPNQGCMSTKNLLKPDSKRKLTFCTFCCFFLVEYCMYCLLVTQLNCNQNAAHVKSTSTGHQTSVKLNFSTATYS